jgi:hypothetical protein
MLSVRENLGFCLLVARAAGSIYLEPASVITYLDGPPLEWSDMPFYALRWSEEGTLASLHRFRDEWHLTEDAYFTRFSARGAGPGSTGAAGSCAR